MSSKEEIDIIEPMDTSHIPTHVAIIPDGNRRWAKERGFPTFEGHRRGADNFMRITKKAKELGIKILTLWAFSTENWARKKDEVSSLMHLFEQMIDRQLKEAIKEKTRIVHIGRKDRLSPSLYKKVCQSEEKTDMFDAHFLVIGLDYGGRDEIVRAFNKALAHSPQIKHLDEQTFSSYLDTAVLPQPDPDLVIRTSGEQRSSGFMPWQGAYSEYYYSPLYFPDFTPTEFEKAVTSFQDRKRRFGK